MDTSVAYRYITSVPGVHGGEPIVKGTRVPVRSIVLAWRRGVAPEEIPTLYPTVKIAAVFEALSYYSDNQAEVNKYIAKHHVPAEISGTRMSFQK